MAQKVTIMSLRNLVSLLFWGKREEEKYGEKKIYITHTEKRRKIGKREREKVYISRNINLFWKTELEPPRTRAKMAAVNSA